MSHAVKHQHQYPLLRTHMTTTPHTIGRLQPLAVAQRMMREHGIRHLPVLDGGKLLGLLSERDVLLVESLPATDPNEVRAEEAMSQDLVTASPDAPLAEVIETMLARKVGSAVAVEHEHVVGVFTTTDALEALLERLTTTD
ncbi:MAG TPA: CBS domain-containing protein [Polyangia bacterium]